MCHRLQELLVESLGDTWLEETWKGGEEGSFHRLEVLKTTNIPLFSIIGHFPVQRPSRCQWNNMHMEQRRCVVVFKAISVVACGSYTFARFGVWWTVECRNRSALAPLQVEHVVPPARSQSPERQAHRRGGDKKTSRNGSPTSARWGPFIMMLICVGRWCLSLFLSCFPIK